MNDITKTIAQHLVRLGLGYASQGPVQSVVANDGDRAGYVRLGDDQAGVVLFVGNAGRAGICMNGDSSWTDASDAADAVRRYLTGNMVE
jgi:hypothetical protein